MGATGCARRHSEIHRAILDHITGRGAVHGDIDPLLEILKLVVDGARLDLKRLHVVERHRDPLRGWDSDQEEPADRVDAPALIEQREPPALPVEVVNAHGLSCAPSHESSHPISTDGTEMSTSARPSRIVAAVASFELSCSMASSSDRPRQSGHSRL